MSELQGIRAHTYRVFDWFRVRLFARRLPRRPFRRRQSLGSGRRKCWKMFPVRLEDKCFARLPTLIFTCSEFSGWLPFLFGDRSSSLKYRQPTGAKRLEHQHQFPFSTCCSNLIIFHLPNSCCVASNTILPSYKNKHNVSEYHSTNPFVMPTN